MTYRLLALDMDGTLLTSEKRIAPRTRAALEEAARQGIIVALSTGRGPAELKEYRDELKGVVRFGCLISGGLVYDLEKDVPLSVNALESDLALKVLEQGEREHAMVHMLSARDSIIRQHDLDHLESFGMGVYRPLYEKCCSKQDDLASYIAEHPAEIVKVNLYHTSVASRERSREALSHLPLQFAEVESTSLESTTLGVTKAHGLELLCAHVGCSLEECVAVGDAANDIEILQAAGRSVAMGNATPEVLSLADDIVSSNDADGIVEVVERYFLAS